jgi:transcriptional regulator with XRE-family HTH domain
MLITQINGAQIRDARALLHLSPQQLADRAGISRLTVRTYELSSGAVPAARVDKLCRVITVLESAGVRFHRDGAVSLQRPAQASAVSAGAHIEAR